MISIDSSIMVKWFKKGEKDDELALMLKDYALFRRRAFVVSEYVFLEIVRAMTKAKYPKTKIRDN